MELPVFAVFTHCASESPACNWRRLAGTWFPSRRAAKRVARQPILLGHLAAVWATRGYGNRLQPAILGSNFARAAIVRRVSLFAIGARGTGCRGKCGLRAGGLYIVDMRAPFRCCDDMFWGCGFAG